MVLPAPLLNAKQARYAPALPPVLTEMRPMNAHPSAGLWREPLTAEAWPRPCP